MREGQIGSRQCCCISNTTEARQVSGARRMQELEEGRRKAVETGNEGCRIQQCLAPEKNSDILFGGGLWHVSFPAHWCKSNPDSLSGPDPPSTVNSNSFQ